MIEYTTMVVKSSLDLGHLALFLGLRVNQLVLERLAEAGLTGARESHGYLIQHLIESERSITELAARMEVTQQAASKMVAELMKIEMVEVAASGEDRRAKAVRLSEHGWDVVNQTRGIRKQLHADLARDLGAKDYKRARRILLEALDKLGGLDTILSRRVRAPR